MRTTDLLGIPRADRNAAVDGLPEPDVAAVLDELSFDTFRDLMTGDHPLPFRRLSPNKRPRSGPVAITGA